MEFKTDVAHPNMFDDIKSISTIGGVPEINQSISHILETEKGELWGDPDFGTHLHSYLLSYTIDSAVEVVKTDIVQCLTAQEPRISITRDMITIIKHPNEKSLEIRIVYKLKTSGEYGSFIYVANKEE